MSSMIGLTTDTSEIIAEFPANDPFPLHMTPIDPRYGKGTQE